MEILSSPGNVHCQDKANSVSEHDYITKAHFVLFYASQHPHFADKQAYDVLWASLEAVVGQPPAEGETALQLSFFLGAVLHALGCAHECEHVWTEHRANVRRFERLFTNMDSI